MTVRSTHIQSVIVLLDLLERHEQKRAGTGFIVLPPLGALANYLDLSTESIAFIKAVQWVSVFVQDGRDTILKSSLSEENKKAAITLYSKITTPFVYPFSATQVSQHIKSTLSETTRSHLSLLNEWILKEFPIYIPEPGDINALIADLEDVKEDFDKLNLPKYIKEDFAQHIDLYVNMAQKLPFVAHQLLIHESSKLSSWLLSNLPQDAKRVVVRAATAVNLLVAAFIAPAEASGAYETYYAWAAQAQPANKQLEAAAAPLQLAPPIKPAEGE